DLGEEPAFLHEIDQFSRRFRYLVTYNGKCFDAQVLRTRYLIHRNEDPLIGKHHIDMLFIARRLWKRRFQECNLTNLERNLLGFERKDDIPGYLIPSAYTDYLRFANASLIQKVLHHNQWDIVSLAVLMARACLLGEEAPELSAEEHFSLSLLYERRKDYGKAVQHQLQALRSQFAWSQSCLLALAQNLRRLKDFDGMKDLLGFVQKENLTNDLARKLCIICEHDLRDYELGLSLAQMQIAKLERYRGIGSSVLQLLSEWRARKDRLLKKNHRDTETRSLK
ncbi:MAG TPA: ribonuclease H-like domain-containing protein, partial [Acidobacteriota bacterium]|nr:ribonuclease H-like domain-containing protein [Acidobacteriota bacterium]